LFFTLTLLATGWALPATDPPIVKVRPQHISVIAPQHISVIVPSGSQDTIEPTTLAKHEHGVSHYGITFSHGDVSWLNQLATVAGWPASTHEKLALVILRESGGCPNRKGGDVVDKNCELVRVSEWNHRSDTGLLQINGVNYNPKRNKWARVCLDLQICEQAPLLDPLNNLRAGYLLYQYSGWTPWDPCSWDKTRCRNTP
jgi:hypothetical protein